MMKINLVVIFVSNEIDHFKMDENEQIFLCQNVGKNLSSNVCLRNVYVVILLKYLRDILMKINCKPKLATVINKIFYSWKEHS